MTKYTDNLWQDLVRAHGAQVARPDRPATARARVRRRSSVLGASTLGAAGLAVGIVLAMGGTPAYAVTTNGNGVLVKLNQLSALPQVNAKLAAMGTHEQISIQMAAGAATADGPVACGTAGGSSQGGAVVPVKVLVGSNGTEVIPSGNTGAGTWHLAECTIYGASTGAGSGSSGTLGSSGTSGSSGIAGNG